MNGSNNGEFFQNEEYAEIRQVELGNEQHNENAIRVYCTQLRNDGNSSFNFQIRTYKSILPFGNGKPRDMVATVGLTIKELEKILEYAKNFEKNRNH